MATERVTLRRAYTDKPVGTVFFEEEGEYLAHSMRKGPPLWLVQLLQGHEMDVEFKQRPLGRDAYIKRVYPRSLEEPTGIDPWTRAPFIEHNGVTLHVQHDAIFIRVPIDLSKWVSES